MTDETLWASRSLEAEKDEIGNITRRRNKDRKKRKGNSGEVDDNTIKDTKKSRITKVSH